jgi:hypothetical protein
VALYSNLDHGFSKGVLVCIFRPRVTYVDRAGEIELETMDTEDNAWEAGTDCRDLGECGTQ